MVISSRWWCGGQKSRDRPFLHALGLVLGWEAEKGQQGPLTALLLPEETSQSQLRESTGCWWWLLEKGLAGVHTRLPYTQPRAVCVFLALPSSVRRLGLGLGCSLSMAGAVSHSSGGKSLTGVLCLTLCCGTIRQRGKEASGFTWSMCGESQEGILRLVIPIY